MLSYLLTLPFVNVKSSEHIYNRPINVQLIQSNILHCFIGVHCVQLLVPWLPSSPMMLVSMYTRKYIVVFNESSAWGFGYTSHLIISHIVCAIIVCYAY